MTGNASHNGSQTVLVTNGTGKTGRRMVERLRARGVPVRVGSRAGEPPFDWEDPRTWIPALRGTGAAYITYFPDVAAPGASQAVAALSQLAVEHGVRRLVLLSGRGEEEAQRSEQELMRSGADWTVIRASWFNQNFSESVFLEPVLAGEVALPADTTVEPFVDVDDIADIAAAALTDARHMGQLYEVTGPRLLTFAEAVAEIARATGREIRYVPIDVETYAAGASAVGVPDDVVAVLRYLFTEVLDGRNAHTTDGVERALGRPPTDFAEFARKAAARGVWNPRVAA